jgi:hypothetical protein
MKHLKIDVSRPLIAREQDALSGCASASKSMSLSNRSAIVRLKGTLPIKRERAANKPSSPRAKFSSARGRLRASAASLSAESLARNFQPQTLEVFGVQ